MQKLTKEQQYELIKRAFEEKNHIIYGYEFFDEMVEICSNSSENYKFEEIDRYGGEGQGEDYWIVYKVTEKETGNYTHYKCSAMYESWSGPEWCSEWKIVEPREIVVTKYFNI